jgi:hypothetical protein
MGDFAMKKTRTALICISLLWCAASVAFAQGIRESGFAGSELDTFWVYRDPLGNANLTVAGGVAAIDVPGPFAHEPVAFSQGGNRAPRIVQRIAAPGQDHGDFDVYAKFTGAMTRQYQMQGILAIQDDKNLVRCELYSDTVGINYLLFTFDDNGDYSNQFVGLLNGVLPGTTPLYVRLKRVGGSFTQYYSLNGVDWTMTVTASHTMYVDSIGVYVANGDSVDFDTDTAPDFSGVVDYFGPVGPVPVQLSSFTAVVQNNARVRLNWVTTSETNNYGFEVQKASETSGFETIPNSFVPGHGTTLEPQFYSYVDDPVTPGRWRYRLKQIDLDATVHFSEPVHVDVLTGVETDKNNLPATFGLHQNFPNPFNPSTMITYDLPKESNVTIEVFNLIGQKVATLLQGVKPPGTHTVQFNAANMTSGVYMYKLTAGGFSATKRMVLIR